MKRDRSLALSASECEASAAIADEPVNAAAPTLASVTPMPAPRATNTVRVLSSAIARPPLSLATAHGMPDRQYHLPRREDRALDFGSRLSSLPAVPRDNSADRLSPQVLILCVSSQAPDPDEWILRLRSASRSCSDVLERLRRGGKEREMDRRGRPNRGHRIDAGADARADAALAGRTRPRQGPVPSWHKPLSVRARTLIATAEVVP
jgi:hypothetical protein